MDEQYRNYLAGHDEELTRAEHERTLAWLVQWYDGVVLDWGCMRGDVARHARRVLFGALACDVVPRAVFGEALERDGIPYEVLTHPWELPYRDGSLGTVVGSGTLEHVPFESASLCELWRVLRPGGTLVLTYLPCRYSVLEAIQRGLGWAHHKRRYTRAGIEALLLAHGFIPVESGYHHSLPMRGPKWIRRIWAACAPVMDGLLGPFGQNLLVVARKVYAIGSEFDNGAMDVYERRWNAAA